MPGLVAAIIAAVIGVVVGIGGGVALTASQGPSGAYSAGSPLAAISDRSTICTAKAAAPIKTAMPLMRPICLLLIETSSFLLAPRRLG